MKAILMSIQPKWCEKIANGQKTIEVRKTRPKIETPFKVYIYCTKGKEVLVTDKVVSWTKEVIGEFVCDEIVTDTAGQFADRFHEGGKWTLDEQRKYGGNKPLYGWHISELKIYDKPKELSEFITVCKSYYSNNDVKCWGCPNLRITEGDKEAWQGDCISKHKLVTRPPQSWCYVEELEG